MDYPKTVAGVGLHPTTKKFWAGDADNPPSRDPFEWANAVTDELLNLIIASGMTPLETDLTQASKAVQSIATSVADARALALNAAYDIIQYDAATRAMGVTYYNDTDRTIWIFVTAKTSTTRDNTCTLDVVVNGKTVCSNSSVNRIAAASVTAIAPVKPKQSYRVNMTGTGATRVAWSESR